MGINQLFVRQIRMKFATCLFLVASASAAPQFGGLKKLVSSLSGDEAPGEVNGDYEQVPYETIQMFEGYEERRYPSVNFACTELEYEMDAEESDNTEWSLERVMKWISKDSTLMNTREYVTGHLILKEQTANLITNKTPSMDSLAQKLRLLIHWESLTLTQNMLIQMIVPSSTSA